MGESPADCWLGGHRFGPWVSHGSDEGRGVNAGLGLGRKGLAQGALVLEAGDLREHAGQRLELRTPVQKIVPVVAATQLLVTRHNGSQGAIHAGLPILRKRVVLGGGDAEAAARAQVGPTAATVIPIKLRGLPRKQQAWPLPVLEPVGGIKCGRFTGDVRKSVSICLNARIRPACHKMLLQGRGDAGHAGTFVDHTDLVIFGSFS